MFQTSSISQQGINELGGYILHLFESKKNKIQWTEKYEYFLKKKIQQIYGDYGIQILSQKKFNYHAQVEYEIFEKQALDLIETTTTHL